MAGFDFSAALSRVINRYQSDLADETDDLSLLNARLAAGDDVLSRRTFPGHVTTSAIIIDEAMTSILLILHKASGRWLSRAGIGSHRLRFERQRFVRRKKRPGLIISRFTRGIRGATIRSTSIPTRLAHDLCAMSLTIFILIYGMFLWHQCLTF